MKKIELEYTFNTSPKLIYPRLSTSGGLSEWFADDVTLKDDTFTFIWDGQESSAKLIHKKKLESIRFQWIDSEENDTYFEFRIEKHELTGDIALIIVDFADEDEKESSSNLWDKQISQLKHVLGL